MFTSLKVVRMAAVDCDCTRRSATRARKRLIGTRCSVRSPTMASTFTGAAGWDRAGRAGAAEIPPAPPLSKGGGEAGRWPASSTSALVTRPPRPEPSMPAASMPFSAISLRAAGPAGAVAAAAGADLAGAAGLAGAAAGAAAAALASVSSWAMTSPATTLSPSPLRIFTSTPSSGAGSSSTTLSVSMSMRFSSRETAWPSCLCQETSVASATDSDSWGTLTSISIILSAYAYHFFVPRASLTRSFCCSMCLAA